MKRVIGPVVAGLGVLVLVAALFMQFSGASGLVKIPTDTEVVSVSEATDASYFDLGSLGVKTGQTIRATREVRADAGASTGDTVVFDATLHVETSGGDEISEASDRVALDRRTAHAVNCCNEQIDGEPTRHTGLSYTFPIGTQRRTYQFFDTAARTAFPISYQATEKVGDLTVYRFEQRITEQVIDQRTLPGLLVGQPTRLLITADEVYSTVRTVWVEPTTGAIVDGRDDQLRVLRAEDMQDIPVFDATFEFTDQSVEEAVDRAADNKARAAVATGVLPLVGIAGGGVLTLVGLVLMYRWNRRRPAPVTAEAPRGDAGQV
jgi:hypothetical protein